MVLSNYFVAAPEDEEWSARERSSPLGLPAADRLTRRRWPSIRAAVRCSPSFSCACTSTTRLLSCFSCLARPGRQRQPFLFALSDRVLRPSHPKLVDDLPPVPRLDRHRIHRIHRSKVCQGEKRETPTCPAETRGTTSSTAAAAEASVLPSANAGPGTSGLATKSRGFLASKFPLSNFLARLFKKPYERRLSLLF